MKALITQKELGEILGLTTHALAKYRRLGIGPAWLKLGTGGRAAQIRYRLSDVEAWLADQEVARDGAAAK